MLEERRSNGSHDVPVRHPGGRVSSTRITRHVNAPRSRVYRALLDPHAIATWRVPTGMSSHVHAFDAREGGAFRISLTYDEPLSTGKTTAHTDTYHGRFATLVPNEQVGDSIPRVTGSWPSHWTFYRAVRLAA
jgi:hypothetical protein